MAYDYDDHAFNNVENYTQVSGNIKLLMSCSLWQRHHAYISKRNEEPQAFDHCKTEIYITLYIRYRYVLITALVVNMSRYRNVTHALANNLKNVGEHYATWICILKPIVHYHRLIVFNALSGCLGVMLLAKDMKRDIEITIVCEKIQSCRFKFPPNEEKLCVVRYLYIETGCCIPMALVYVT